MWKDIIGFEGIYKINEYGTVINLLLKKEMKPYFNNKGYKCIDLSKDGKKYKFSVHRLVAIHFIPNPLGLPIVLHNDNIKTNTHYTNLRWGTYSENNRQAIQDGLNSVPRPDNRKFYELYNGYENRYCYGANEVSIITGVNCKRIRNFLHRETTINEGNYEGFNVRKVELPKPIYFEN